MQLYRFSVLTALLKALHESIAALHVLLLKKQCNMAENLSTLLMLAEAQCSPGHTRQCSPPILGLSCPPSAPHAEFHTQSRGPVHASTATAHVSHLPFYTPDLFLQVSLLVSSNLCQPVFPRMTSSALPRGDVFYT